MKRRSFSLVEIVIAGALTILIVGLCCSALTFFWKMMKEEELLLEMAQTRHRRAAYVRLVLSQIVREKDDPFVLEPAAGNAPERLIFVFDNGVHINPKLHGLVLAMLYVDKQYGLVLVIRSHPSRKELDQKEEEACIIWPGIQQISWKFALRPKDKNEKMDLNDTDWQTRWLKEWKDVPAVIQVELIDEHGNHLPPITSVVMSNLEYIPTK